MTAPRVTVVIPAHNSAGDLPAALESVLGQTVGSWRIAAADDASADGTPDVLASYAAAHPDRISYVTCDRNGGPAATRNAAIAAAPPTELLALLDADDRWLPTYLERQLSAYDNAAGAGARVGAVACDALYETPGGQPLGRFSELHGWSDPVTYERMLERSDVWIGALVSRGAFDAVGGRFAEDCWGSEDYDLWLRLLEAGYEIVANKEVLAVYRAGSSSVSANHGRMARAGIVAYRHALGRGALDRRRRRLVHRRIRHHRALAARSDVVGAWQASRPGGAALAALRAMPLGLIALLQSPRRWGEWLRDLGKRAGW